MSEASSSESEPSGDWQGNHPLSEECSNDGCTSVEMNIINTAQGERVVICKQCGRCNFA